MCSSLYGSVQYCVLDPPLCSRALEQRLQASTKERAKQRGKGRLRGFTLWGLIEDEEESDEPT